MRNRSTAAVFGLALGFALLASEMAIPGEKQALPKDLPAFGADKPLPTPKIEEQRLANGLTLWVVPKHAFPRVSVVLAVRGGTASDPKGAEGVAELLADTVKDGATTRSSKAIAEALQSAGADIEGQAGDEAIFVRVDGLSAGLPTLVQILADLAEHATFPDAEVELAKGNAIQSLEANEATPAFQAHKEFAKAVYGDHPYHITSASRATLEAATSAGLKAEFARRFRPESALLVIVGDIDPVVATSEVKKSFGTWAGRGPGIEAIPPSPEARPRRLFAVNRQGSVQTEILLGRVVPGVTDPDYYPLVVANTVCAGSFSSRLVSNIREDKGYTYSPRGSVQEFPKGGLLTIGAAVRNDVTGASLMEIFYELDRMATTMPADEEMARAKRYQSGLYLLRNQIQGSVARTLANNWVNGLPPEALGEFVTKVSAVSADDVRRAGRKYFTSSTQTVVLVGDEGKIREEVRPFGEVETVTP